MSESLTIDVAERTTEDRKNTVVVALWNEKRLLLCPTLNRARCEPARFPVTSVSYLCDGWEYGPA